MADNSIHPISKPTLCICACGEEFSVVSTATKERLSLDTCSACHPFYTGQQANVETGGNIDKFNQRFGGISL